MRCDGWLRVVCSSVNVNERLARAARLSATRQTDTAPDESMLVEVPPNITVALSHARGDAGTLHVFFPDPDPPAGLITRPVVLIVPGGSYRPGPFGWCKIAEGSAVAHSLAKRERLIAAVLHYRMPAGNAEAPLEDIAEAIEMLRKRAKHEWQEAFRPTPLVALMGFSAGGHLAAMAATAARYQDLIVTPSQRARRPDLLVLFYPLLSMDAASNATHANSRREFLGRDQSDARARAFSAEHRLQNATPPTLLVHARDDRVVPIGGSWLYWEACRMQRVSCTLVELSRGGHPFVTHAAAWGTAQRASRLWLEATARALSEVRWDRVPARAGAGESSGSPPSFLWPISPATRVIGTDFPLPALESQALHRKLEALEGVARVDSTHLLWHPDVVRRAIRAKIATAPRLAAPTRPPPWVVETWGDPGPGDSLPF